MKKETVWMWLIVLLTGCLHAEDNKTEINKPDKTFPFEMEISRIFPQNQLINGDFEMPGDTKDCPNGWHANNCVGTSEVKLGITSPAEARDGKVAVYVKAQGDWPGYWEQKIQVVPGARYYASVDSRFDVQAMLLRIYKEIDIAAAQLEMVSYQGVGLDDFIDPKYLDIAVPDQWRKWSLEVVIPGEGKAPEQYYFGAGSYGVGWVLMDNAYFAEAAWELQGTVKGKSIQQIKVIDKKGQVLLDQQVKPEADSHSFTAKIPSRLMGYFVEVTTTQKNIFRRMIHE